MPVFSCEKTSWGLPFASNRPGAASPRMTNGLGASIHQTRSKRGVSEVYVSHSPHSMSSLQGYAAVEDCPGAHGGSSFGPTDDQS